MQSQHVLEKIEKLTTSTFSIFRQNGQPFFAENYLETFNRNQKNAKYEKLKKSQRKVDSSKKVKIEIFNDTDLTIPDNVLEALSDGFNVRDFEQT